MSMDQIKQELVATNDALLKAELRLNSLEMINTRLAKTVATLCQLHSTGQTEKVKQLLDGMAHQYQQTLQTMSRQVH